MRPLSRTQKKRYAFIGVLLIALIFLMKRLGRHVRHMPTKPKITFTPPIYITTSEPVLPIVNHADANKIVFSIVIPVDIDADFDKLARCLDAVRDQKTKLPRVEFVLRAEIIVVHDGLSTELEEYIEHCKSWFPSSSHEKSLGYDCKSDKHLLRFVSDSADTGLSGALNFGIKHARGTWVLPLDVEDQLHPLFFAEVSLALDEAGGLSVHNPGTYNVIMPSVMDFHKTPLNWQPSANTSTILYENMLHGSGLFLRSTWEGEVQFSQMMMLGWADWDFWIKLESRVGITALVVSKPSLKFNITHHRSDFCSEHRHVCIALLQLNNPCVYEKTHVAKAFKVVREYLTQESHPSEWYIVSQEAVRGDRLAQMLVSAKAGSSSAKRLFSQFYRGQCISNEREQCDMSTRIIADLADKQAASSMKSLFHMIVSRVPADDTWVRMAAHSLVGVLDRHRSATLVVHTDLDMDDIFRDDLLRHYGRRVVSSPIFCHSYLAEQHGFSDTERAIRRYGGGRPLQLGHFTDYLRFLVLFSFGGVYLDTDLLLRQSVSHFRNVVAVESSGSLNGAFMSFDRGSPVMRYCLEQAPLVHDPFDAKSLGPSLVTAAAKVYSSQINDTDGSLLFSVLPRQTFYGTHRSSWRDLVTHSLSEREYDQRGSTDFGYHFRGSMFFMGFSLEGASSSSLLGHALRETCLPEVMTCVQLGRVGGD